MGIPRQRQSASQNAGRLQPKRTYLGARERELAQHRSPVTIYMLDMQHVPRRIRYPTCGPQSPADVSYKQAIARRLWRTGSKSSKLPRSAGWHQGEACQMYVSAQCALITLVHICRHVSESGPYLAERARTFEVDVRTDADADECKHSLDSPDGSRVQTPHPWEERRDKVRLIGAY